MVLLDWPRRIISGLAQNAAIPAVSASDQPPRKPGEILALGSSCASATLQLTRE
jgi:hypothetical protein